jgi:hypothetical protein
VIRLTIIAALAAVGISAGCISSQKRAITPGNAEQWHTNNYPNIGLSIALPGWKAEIDDQNKSWTLFAFPLVDDPVASEQYGVAIQIRKMQAKDHLLYYPKFDGTNAGRFWVNYQHLNAEQESDPYWVTSRRDIFSQDGRAYYCIGNVKRVGDKWELGKEGRVGGDYHPLVQDTQKIFESIRVISSNTSLPSVEETPHRR